MPRPRAALSRWALRPAGLAALIVLLPFAAPKAQGQDVERWSFVGALSASRATNLFLAPGGGSGETIGGLSLTLSYLRSRQRSRLLASAWALGLGYQKLDQLDTANAGLALDGNWSFTRTARLRYTQSFARGFNPDRLYGKGVLLPQFDVTSSASRLGFSWDATPSTTLDLSGDADWIRYDSALPTSSTQLGVDTFPEQAARPGLEGAVKPPLSRTGSAEPPPLLTAPDNTLYVLNLVSLEGVLASRLTVWTYRVGAGLSHEFSPKTQGGLSLAYRESRYDSVRPAGDFVERTGLASLGLHVHRQLGTTLGGALSYTLQRNTIRPLVTTHNVTGQLDKRFSERFQMDGSLGASYWSGEAAVPSGWGVVGDVGGSLRFERASALARVSRSVYQALGFGRVLTTDFAYLSASGVPAKRILVGAYAGYRHSSDNLDRSFSFQNGFVGAFAGWRVGKRTTLGGSWAWRRYRLSPFPAASGSVFSVSVSWGKVWG